MMMDGGLGPVVNSAWAGSMQLAWADSGADGLVPTVFDGLVPTVYDGLVPMVCGSLVLAVDNGLVPTGCSAWAGSVRSVRADSDGMPELGGSAQWSTAVAKWDYCS